MLTNILSCHQHHFDVWYYHKMTLIHEKIYAKNCSVYVICIYDMIIVSELPRGNKKLGFHRKKFLHYLLYLYFINMKISFIYLFLFFKNEDFFYIYSLL